MKSQNISTVSRRDNGTLKETTREYRHYDLAGKITYKNKTTVLFDDCGRTTSIKSQYCRYNTRGVLIYEQNRETLYVPGTSRVDKITTTMIRYNDRGIMTSHTELISKYNKIGKLEYETRLYSSFDYNGKLTSKNGSISVLVDWKMRKYSVKYDVNSDGKVVQTRVFDLDGNLVYELEGDVHPVEIVGMILNPGQEDMRMREDLIQDTNDILQRKALLEEKAKKTPNKNADYTQTGEMANGSKEESLSLRKK